MRSDSLAHSGVVSVESAADNIQRAKTPRANWKQTVHCVARAQPTCSDCPANSSNVLVEYLLKANALERAAALRSRDDCVCLPVRRWNRRTPAAPAREPGALPRQCWDRD